MSEREREIEYEKYCHLELSTTFQADLDDGHCPSWPNQLRGLYNIYQFVHGNMTGQLPSCVAVQDSSSPLKRSVFQSVKSI